MNITFMIGNGFDVGLGLPSKYIDFFQTYVQDSKNKPPEIKQLSERIHANHKTWADFETQMGQYTHEVGAPNKHQYPLQLRDFETAFIPTSITVPIINSCTVSFLSIMLTRYRVTSAILLHKSNVYEP